MLFHLLLAAALTPPTISSCASAPKQAQTVAVIRRLETEWTQAYIGGDTAFLACLQDPNFVDAQGDGGTHFKAQELTGALAAAKRHIVFDPTTAPVPAIYIHDGVAIATGVNPKAGSNGKHGRRWTDIYRYDGMHWHAIFSQASVF